MKVTVQYTAQIKAALGVAQEHLELEESASVSNLLAVLANRHAEPFRNLVLTDDAQLMPSIVLCIQDQQIPPGEDTALSDGDTVLFLSAISGG